jgi:hypothetical protein
MSWQCTTCETINGDDVAICDVCDRPRFRDRNKIAEPSRTEVRIVTPTAPPTEAGETRAREPGTDGGSTTSGSSRGATTRLGVVVALLLAGGIVFSMTRNDLTPVPGSATPPMFQIEYSASTDGQIGTMQPEGSDTGSGAGESAIVVVEATPDAEIGIGPSVTVAVPDPTATARPTRKPVRPSATSTRIRILTRRLTMTRMPPSATSLLLATRLPSTDTPLPPTAPPPPPPDTPVPPPPDTPVPPTAPPPPPDTPVPPTAPPPPPDTPVPPTAPPPPPDTPVPADPTRTAAPP